MEWFINFLISLFTSNGIAQNFQVNFLLYTEWNQTAPSILDINSAPSVLTSNFNSSLPVKLIIHGYRETVNDDWIVRMKDELLIYAPTNVILVDWQDGAVGWYATCSANTQPLGDTIFDLLSGLRENTGLSFSDVHLIGFSLGAQAASYVGKHSHDIGRISGLDPAGPDFSDRDASSRIDPSDAQFVDVIHTNGEPLWEGGFGYYEPCGHVDFYPNGGKRQPGCWNQGESCHHMRAPDYYIESINSNCPFTSYQCALDDHSCSSCDGNCGFMGFHADKSQAHGVFYTETNSESPFCQD